MHFEERTQEKRLFSNREGVSNDKTSDDTPRQYWMLKIGRNVCKQQNFLFSDQREKVGAIFILFDGFAKCYWVVK